MAQRILVAQIGAAHGIRGEVRWWSFTAEPMAVKGYGELISEDGSVTVKIESVRPAKDFLVARLAGIGDRTAAQRLCNTKLYVPRERLPAAEPGAFYHADLIGLAVITEDGRALGRVVAVPNFGAGDLIEIEPAAGAKTFLMPFTAAAVPQIDLAGGRLVVDPPAGLLPTSHAEGAG